MIYSQTAEPSKSGARRQGAVLVFAVVILGLLTTLGMLYVRHMSTEIQSAGLDQRRTHARLVAEGGANAAIADLQRAVQSGQAVQVLDKERTYEFPTYTTEWTGKERRLVANTERRATARVTITDESGRINLNHAPASVLQAILGIDGATARGITSSLPRAGDQGRQWLIGVDDLLSRELLTEEQFAAVDRSLVTTYTVMDHSAAKGFLNINTAPVKVLAAVLGITEEAAAKVSEKRPFQSLSALAAAAEKEPATFNIKPDPFSPGTLPAALALESRCFRVVCQSDCAWTRWGHDHNKSSARVDAVVVLQDGGYEVLHWSASRDTAAS